ncbi:Zn-dependent alcohol dehydrogenase [Saccharopolyspora erythraea]|uniref:Zn-dependent alcohol dehydrogenase n=1 Tax=Saccharopolyspora erythraea TaxID=1836 RepID=UPI001BAAA48B|nr:Zn-dependent alcohol dehydrogenase [Saccharopolyspora erythraea]QUH01494.1 Zn-dependent alcohol dehydrogenase [Saccharopolyspora erythraea]
MTAAQAAVLREIGGELRVEDVELPAPGPGRVRVKLAATGVCHSDLSLATGVLAHPAPVVLGHEGAGRVVEVGEGVEGLRPGDPVVLNWTPPCRECWFCTHQQPYLCPHASDAMGRPYGTLADTTPVYPGLGTAAFATETLVGANACIPLPEDVPLEQAALLGCAVLTGAGAVFNAARVRPGESVVVFGLGGIGLCAVQAARIAGAGPIIAVDPAVEKFDLARRLGAPHALEPSSDLSKRIRKLTEGRGADHAFECVGRAETIRGAWSATRRGGQATIVGLGSVSDEVTFNALEIGHFARTLRGCMYGSTDPRVDVPVLLQHYRDGALDLDSLVSQRIALEDIGESFARMKAGHGARSVVVFE